MKHHLAAMSLFAFGLAPSSALAGDHWQACGMINGSIYTFDGETLYEVEGDKRTKLAYKTLQKTTIADEVGYCQNKAGRKFGWANHVYIMELEITGSMGPLKTWAICEEGGSGFPANNQTDTNCVKEAHTKNKRLVPQYEDLADE